MYILVYTYIYIIYIYIYIYTHTHIHLYVYIYTRTWPSLHSVQGEQWESRVQSIHVTRVSSSAIADERPLADTSPLHPPLATHIHTHSHTHTHTHTPHTFTHTHTHSHTHTTHTHDVNHLLIETSLYVVSSWASKTNWPTTHTHTRTSTPNTHVNTQHAYPQARVSAHRCVCAVGTLQCAATTNALSV